jgi:hypothetical protein
MGKPIIYTVGHSTHTITFFLDLLNHFGINYLADVRSLPASRFNPQYNKKSLARSLEDYGIRYHHFGEEFGARQSAPDLLDEEGKVDFSKMRASVKFKAGIEQLKKDTGEGYVIALMCSESDPLSCHRFSMISPALKEFEVKHILKDVSAVNQAQLEEQLLKQFASKLQLDIFQPRLSREDQLQNAYKLLNKEVGYSPVAHRKK